MRIEYSSILSSASRWRYCATSPMLEDLARSTVTARFPLATFRRKNNRSKWRNWSYGVLEREVRANLVYRDFTRVGGTKMPDAKTMGRPRDLQHPPFDAAA